MNLSVYLRNAHGHITRTLLKYDIDNPYDDEHDELNWVALSSTLPESYALIQDSKLEKVLYWKNKITSHGNRVELWVTHEAIDHIKSNLSKLHDLGLMYAMTFDINKHASCLLNDTRVRKSTVYDYINVSKIIIESFGMKDTSHPLIWSLSSGSEDPNITIWVAEINGVACGTLTSVIHENVVHLWAVGVLKDYQRKGIASGLLSTAMLHAAKKGASMGFLCATQDGKKLYDAHSWDVLESWHAFSN
jgi:ribosomal protein S18 acetylase RimI-like enzyme